MYGLLGCMHQHPFQKPAGMKDAAKHLKATWQAAADKSRRFAVYVREGGQSGSAECLEALIGL